MQVKSKRFIEEITVMCTESERLETIDWLTNHGYEPDPDIQIRSNESYIVATKSTTIYITGPTKEGDSEVEAARLYVKETHRFRVIDDEHHIPKVVITKISDFPISVVFRTPNIDEELSIYITEDQGNYRAVGWSSET